MSTKIPPRLFFLQNVGAGYVGNSPLWWAKGGAGYTADLSNAALFTQAEYRVVIRGTKSSHGFRAWPVDQVLLAANPTLDIQNIADPVAGGRG